jgi:hypothetical protein
MVPYREGFNYGMGVRSATAGPLAPGAAGSITSVTGAPGGSGGFHLSRVQSTEEVESQLGISADASGGVGLFSASARFDFAKNCKVQSTSLTLVVSATSQKGFQQIDTPALTADAGNLVSQGKLDMFAERYGDVFVRGMHVGGQFFGVFRIDTKSEASRQRVDSSLAGSYGPFSGDAHFNLTETCSRENATIFCDAYWEGGKVTVQPTTPDGLLAALKQWSETVDDQDVPYLATLAPYIIAQGPEPPNQEDLQHQRDVLKQCARLRSQTLDKLNLVEYIMDPLHAPEFDAPAGAPDLAALHAGLSTDLDMIAAAASWAEDHPKEAVDPETFARTKRSQPTYQLTLVPTNMWKHIGATVVVPDFRTATSADAASQLAAANRLTLHWTDDGTVSNTFQIISQDPGPATPVSPGATVTLKTHISELAWRLRQRVLIPAAAFARA